MEFTFGESLAVTHCTPDNPPPYLENQNTQQKIHFKLLLESATDLNPLGQKQERNSNQAQALLGRSNMGTNRPTDAKEALCSRLKMALSILALYEP
jgi:hypothetical protein